MKENLANENKKEYLSLSEVPEKKIEEEKKKTTIKTEMCQLIYYDFSLK
jgi:hypothetical protein